MFPWGVNPIPTIVLYTLFFFRIGQCHNHSKYFHFCETFTFNDLQKKIFDFASVSVAKMQFLRGGWCWIIRHTSSECFGCNNLLESFIHPLCVEQVKHFTAG